MARWRQRQGSLVRAKRETKWGAFLLCSTRRGGGARGRRRRRHPSELRFIRLISCCSCRRRSWTGRPCWRSAQTGPSRSRGRGVASWRDHAGPAGLAAAPARPAPPWVPWSSGSWPGAAAGRRRRRRRRKSRGKGPGQKVFLERRHPRPSCRRQHRTLVLRIY